MAVDNNIDINDAYKRYREINLKFTNTGNKKLTDINSSEDLEDNIENALSPYDSLLFLITDNSFSHLTRCYYENRINRRSFKKFFLWLLSVQFAFIGLLVILKGFKIIELSDLIIEILVVSAFVETLGVVTIMVTFVFNSKSEVKIINAIQKVAEHYKK